MPTTMNRPEIISLSEKTNHYASLFASNSMLDGIGHRLPDFPSYLTLPQYYFYFSWKYYIILLLEYPMHKIFASKKYTDQEKMPVVIIKLSKSNYSRCQRNYLTAASRRNPSLICGRNQADFRFSRTRMNAHPALSISPSASSVSLASFSSQ